MADDRLADVRVLGVAGSIRSNSLSHRALALAMDIVDQIGCQTATFDLRRTPLPFCNDGRFDPWQPAVREWRDHVSRAHALILVTPEYHGSLSGVLKNAIDLLDCAQLGGKIVGLIEVLGGPPNTNAVNDLRRIMRWCHCWVIPEQIAIGRAREVFTEPSVFDPELEERFESFAVSLVQSTLRLHEAFAPPDLRGELRARVRIDRSVGARGETSSV